MQALQLTRELDRIVRELKIAELIGLLRAIVQNPENVNIDEGFRARFSAAIMNSYGGYQVASLDPELAKILTSFQIARVYDTTRIGILITALGQSANIHALRGNAVAFPLFSNFYEMLTWLSTVSGACTLLLEKEKIGSVPPEDKIVEIELVDYDGTPETITTLLSTMATIHSDVAHVLGQTSQLKVLYLDSGSGVRFGFGMATSVADTLTKLALQVWEKFRYRRYDDFDREIESLSKGLDFIAKVNEQVENKVLSEEDGKIFAQKTVRNMRTIIGLGAMLPLEKSDERKLLSDAKELKLLGSGNPTETPGNPPSTNSPN